MPSYFGQDDFIEALEPLRNVPRKKLKAALAAKTGGGGGGGGGPPAKLRHAESQGKTAGEVIELRGKYYTLIALLSKGNAEIWSCTDELGAARALKITDAQSVVEEIEARKRLGWSSHARHVLEAFDYGGPCLVLERAERTLRHRIDTSAIDRATVPTYLKAILLALQEIHGCRLVHMDIKPANIFQVLDSRTGDVNTPSGRVEMLSSNTMFRCLAATRNFAHWCCFICCKHME